MGDLTYAETKQRARAHREAGDLDGAVATLQAFILQHALQLADIYGILGGTRRDQGDLVAAAAAYDAGFDIDLQFNTLGTYNAVNRVITRVLLAPASLSDPETLRGQETLEFVDVISELGKMETQLRRNVTTLRSDDYWAAADLATIAALNGHLTEATEAVDRFVSCSPPDTAHKTFRKALQALAQLDTPRRSTLESVLHHVDLRRAQ